MFNATSAFMKFWNNFMWCKQRWQFLFSLQPGLVFTGYKLNQPPLKKEAAQICICIKPRYAQHFKPCYFYIVQFCDMDTFQIETKILILADLHRWWEETARGVPIGRSRCHGRNGTRQGREIARSRRSWIRSSGWGSPSNFNVQQPTRKLHLNL